MAGFLPNDVFVVQADGSTEVTKVTYSEILGGALTPDDIGVNVASLVGGLVPTEQLPSYIDDVIEAADFGSLPATGETGKIYVALDTNKTYRWSGSAYVEIGSGLYASDIGVTIQPYDANTVIDSAYVHTDYNYDLAAKTKVDYISVTGAINLDNVVMDGDIGVTVQAYNADTVVDSSYVHTDNNYDTASKTKVDFISVTGAIDLDTVVSDSDIGVTVQAYDVNTVVDSSYVHTDNNFTTGYKDKLDFISVTGAVDLDTVVSDSDIGVTVQGYNVDTVVDSSYVHTDNNFTTGYKDKLDFISVTGAIDLDTALVDADIGVTVQAYDANTVSDVDYATVKATINAGGDTASRPASPTLYQNYFDTTLAKPIWYDGSDWVDATGATV